MRPTTLLAARLGGLVLTIGLVTAAENAAALRPLDLPSGGRGEASDDEDFPETIQFFGSSYEGDGFFFLLDKSGSMNGLKMELLKVEMGQALSELSSPSEFGIVAFSGDVVRYSEFPVEATVAARINATLWVESLEPFGATLMLTAALELLTISQLSTRAERSLIFVGDGVPNSPLWPETLTGILAANWESLPIHTILLGSASEDAANFMSQLSSATGGTFRANPL